MDKDNHILSEEYNGATTKFSDDVLAWDSPGEIDNDVLRIKNTFVVHSELHAILNYRGSLSDLKGSTIYVTRFPCHECATVICQFGIQKVIYQHSQYVKAAKLMFLYANVEVEEYHPKTIY